jgi:hypothetical protein
MNSSAARRLCKYSIVRAAKFPQKSLSSVIKIDCGNCSFVDELWRIALISDKND